MLDVTFNGTPICATLGIMLADDGFADTPPAPKTVKVSVPYGSDIDITESVAPVAYSNREQSFTFLVPAGAGGLMTVANRLKRLVHGVSGTWSLSWEDEPYSYSGRWSVDDVAFYDNASGYITCSADCSPYKTGTMVEEIDAFPAATVSEFGTMADYALEAKCPHGATVTKGSAAYDVTADYSTLFTLSARSTATLNVAASVGAYIDGDALVLSSASVASGALTLPAGLGGTQSSGTLTVDGSAHVVTLRHGIKDL